MRWCIVFLMSGCFSPQLESGKIVCSTDGRCPSPLRCGADNHCWAAGEEPVLGPDASPDLVAASVDGGGAPDLTSFDLVGACSDGVKDGDESDVDCGGGCAPCGTGLGCAAAHDCASGFCNLSGHLCVASACMDGVMDGDESDVDCGGACTACAESAHCVVAADCQSLICNGMSLLCVASLCEDGAKDGNETDIDCGGGCGGCLGGHSCAVDGDCVSKLCNGSTRLCAASQCDDGAKDGAETDVDCGGGTCPKCGASKACLAGADCQSSFCNGGTHACVDNQCQDGAKDGAETDADCGGGACLPCVVGKSCISGADCASGTCSAGHLCVSTQCQDGVKNGLESDVDCGGSVCAGCALNAVCAVNGDCASGFCSAVSHKCVATQCQDGVNDGSESDVDCGGSTCAARCALGKSCNLGGDCSSGFCNANTHQCVASQCGDAVRDGSESDIDCGGSCSKCVLGQACVSGSDCTSGLCNAVNKSCVSSACQDAVKDGSESDIDCGGTTCASCPVGSGCLANPDCSSGFCNGSTNKCVASQCQDGAKDGLESDVDCGGGSCNACATGLKCVHGSDCVTVLCSATTHLCVSTQCQDGVKDGSESDVDCGGACAHCGIGAACGSGSDCTSTFCSAGHLCVSTQCQDGIKNGAESDVDCGGGTCSTCTVGKTCSAGSDCASGNCSAGHLCVSTQCQDGVKNGAETDIDCGGGTCSACANGKGCLAGGDCVSSLCNLGSHQCVATQCQDGVKDGAESDIDCGGTTCSACANGKSCLAGSDCTTTFCNQSLHACVATQCQDGATDGAESDVDCGGATCNKCATGAHCNGSTDCSSGFCNGSSHTCVSTQCQDGVKDGIESDVDCGGGTCPACANNKACGGGSDCASGFCNGTSHLCVATQCQDGVKNGTESDVDCGGSCSGCANNKACGGGGDCASGFCNASTHLCVATQCLDGVKNGTESDVDCGGSCSKCANNKSCASGTDCTSTFCNGSTHLCVATQCLDGAKDGAESDIDCGGGTCGGCVVGKTCVSGSDCASASCNVSTHLCASGQCGDGAKNGAETDIDCGGGTCPTCATGLHCAANTDCVSSFCNLPSTLCVATQCQDGVKDGSETDVDCGSTCSKCANNKGCNAGSDCVSTFCDTTSHLCVATQCLDEIKDGSETDKDCGGPTCPGCANNKGCLLGGDCMSSICNSITHLCVSSPCADGVKDNAETDVDCGGGSCGGCALGKACVGGGDCASGWCHATSHVCVSGECSDGALDGSESDVDCGGSCPSHCGSGKRCNSSSDCNTGLSCSGGKCVVGP